MRDDEPIHLPTQGHILTALDYQLAQERVALAAYHPGMVMKYPWPGVLPGWIRCTGEPVDPTVHPRLYVVTNGVLPNDPDHLIKL